jgi:Tfp pilus assembly protein PilN
MIKVNLAGNVKKKSAARSSVNIASLGLTRVLMLLIVLGSLGGGYLWYLTLTGQSADLDDKVKKAQAEKARLDAVIKADQVFEARKKILEARVKVIEGLQKGQASPVLALDELAQAVEKTQYVWLSTLDQKDAALSMSGMGTSLNAIADFYTNLLATGYFRNIDLGPSQESAGNFTFSLKCEFAPPRAVAGNPPVEIAGGN